MEKLDTEDGQLFIRNLASFVRTHEKALANALQMRRQPSRNASSSSLSGGVPTTSTTSSSSPSSTLAAALSFGALSFTSQNIKPAKLTLTPHHLFFLLSRFEELTIPVGPMNIRLENINSESSPANYVSFLNQSKKSTNRGWSDRDSIHSVSSVRSVMSGMSSLWSSLGLGGSSSASKSEKAKAAVEADLKYLFSAFTKIPCLRLSPDHHARLIRGYEEFPFDTAVPLHAFKNVSALEVIDVDFRQFFGWDRMAEHLRSLTVKRAHLDDPADLITGIVLDDMDRRRKRSTKSSSSPVIAWVSSSPGKAELARSNSYPPSPVADTLLSSSASPRYESIGKDSVEESKKNHHARTGSVSPNRPTSSRHGSTYRHNRGTSTKVKRSGSGSSNSSDNSAGHRYSMSGANLLALGVLSSTKWRFLRHLSLADNSLTTVSVASLAPLASTLHSLDLSSNLFTEVPESLASLISLRALNLSNCMIDSLHSLARNPLPAITALNLRANRLRAIAGIERLLSLERLDLRDNRLSDPTEIARLTSIPDMREIWVKHNPFTKTHGNYRVVIFNLFRKTPGYSDDVLIDAAGPGYSERKQLVDRVVEPDKPPVVRAPEPSEELAPPVVVQPHIKKDVPATVKPNMATQQRPIPHAVRSDYAIKPTRRHKGPRRRIVDLSREEAGTSTLISNQTVDLHLGESIESISPRSKPVISSTVQGAVDDKRPERSSAESPGRPPDRTVASYFESLNKESTSEQYRQSLEALKKDLGENWLSVLSEQGWEGTKESMAEVNGYGRASSSHVSPPVPRTNSQAIMSGGRTLG